MTGSAIGSTLGQIFHVDNKRLMLLVGCGAAGAITGSLGLRGQGDPRDYLVCQAHAGKTDDANVVVTG